MQDFVKTVEARFDRVILLRRDGTIEGAEGPLGLGAHLVRELGLRDSTDTMGR